jgi:hypothetical protein
MKLRNIILLISLLLIAQNVSATLLSNDFFGRSDRAGSFAFPQGFPNFGGFNFFGNQQQRPNAQGIAPAQNTQPQTTQQPSQLSPISQPEALIPQFNPLNVEP